MNKKIKCEIVPYGQIYPKGKKIRTGDWGVITATVGNIYEDSEITPSSQIKIAGNFPELDFTQNYKLIATQTKNNYGISYELDFICSLINLTGKENQNIFLQSILTEKELDLLYSKFESPMEVIKNKDFESLTQIKGIGVSKATKLIKKYEANIDLSSIYIHLKDLGLTKRMIDKLVATYSSPETVVEKILDNPYILANEVTGIGFKKADEIALKNGIGVNSEKRIQGFILSHLQKQGQLGHSFIYPNELMYDIKEYLGQNIDKDAIRVATKNMKEEGILWWDENKTVIALEHYHGLEKNILREVKRILNGSNKFKYDDYEEKLKILEEKQGWSFIEEQREFIAKGLKENLVVLSGFGGSGKSTVVNALINILSEYNTVGVALAGKASDRLGELSDCETMTIHRLLGYSSEGFCFNKSNQLEGIDIILVDEVSMIGGGLFYSLIQSIKTGTKLILIGDDGQLEAIGECNIFSDLLSSEIPKVRLNKIHRQAQKSAIKTDSLKIRKGVQITSETFNGKDVKGELKDFIIDAHSDKIFTAPKIIKYFKEEIKDSNIMDVQIIVPMKKRGDVSTYEINQQAQDIYNPIVNQNMKEVMKDGKKYQLRVGDKIIIRKNNYKTLDMNGKIYPVYNGNIGIIEEVNDLIGSFLIRLKNGVKVFIDFNYSSTIELGYAITVHSSQGSQFKIVIGGIDYSAYPLLTRELIYTLITRAEKKMILSAENKALRYAIDTTYVSEKQTFLKDFLESYLTE